MLLEKVRQERRRQAAFDHDENHKEFNDLGAGKASNSEANEAEADMESITAEKVVTFPCDLCDFSSNWQTGLNIHMGIKHATIEQTDGCCENLDSDTENEEYNCSLHYWRNGWL